MNLHEMSASRMGKLIRSRELSPVELVQTQLARIDQLNPKLNAFVELRTELALAEARQAEMALQHGDAVGPLHGIPISIKSSIAVAGLKLECGSRTRAGLVAQRDAVLVARLKAAEPSSSATPMFPRC